MNKTDIVLSHFLHQTGYKTRKGTFYKVPFLVYKVYKI